MVKSKLSERAKLLLLAGEMAAAGALVVILLVFAASVLDAYLIKKGQWAAVITSAIFDLTNTDRRINNVQEPTVSPRLTAVAQAKANDMAAKGYFSHTAPDGVSPWYWFKREGYVFTFAGENLAIDFSDSADVERAWMNSPTHRANILNGRFTEIGIATAVGTYQGRQTTFVVQMFGTPAHPEAVPETLTPTDLNQPSSPQEIALATTEPKPTAAPRTAGASAGTGEPAPAGQGSEAVTLTDTQGASDTASTEVLGSSAEGLVASQPAGLEAIWSDFAASPRTTMRYAYYLFGILILIALAIETGIEIRKHHLKHVGIVLGLILLMGVLFFLADTFVFTTPVLTDTAGIEASP